jgi:hypothetical protein
MRLRNICELVGKPCRSSIIRRSLLERTRVDRVPAPARRGEVWVWRHVGVVEGDQQDAAGDEEGGGDQQRDVVAAGDDAQRACG